MPRSTYQRLLGFIGKLVVVLILGFLVLPAAVVTIAALNDALSWMPLIRMSVTITTMTIAGRFRSEPVERKRPVAAS